MKRISDISKDIESNQIKHKYMLLSGCALLIFLSIHICVPSFGKYLRKGLVMAWNHVQEQAKRHDYKQVINKQEVYNPVLGIETTYAAETKNNDLIKSIVNQAEDENISISECTKLGGFLQIMGEDNKPETWRTKCTTPAIEGKQTGLQRR